MKLSPSDIFLRTGHSTASCEGIGIRFEKREISVPLHLALAQPQPHHPYSLHHSSPLSHSRYLRRSGVLSLSTQYTLAKSDKASSSHLDRSTPHLRSPTQKLRPLLALPLRPASPPRLRHKGSTPRLRLDSNFRFKKKKMFNAINTHSSSTLPSAAIRRRQKLAVRRHSSHTPYEQTQIRTTTHNIRPAIFPSPLPLLGSHRRAHHQGGHKYHRCNIIIDKAVTARPDTTAGGGLRNFTAIEFLAIYGFDQRNRLL
ncbi:IQ motif and SEC7 domain-containing protein 1 [Striga asiatica]|uniref:IQ motif and SEC7 domain-containing protein 1 n=1 Tax=Striga asiatica TaxID=4170 RepID=A0A5A7PEK4_STRAF|nr:IQ motif and SEC7 domain-containing protein 1 [Striga asiatica]